MKCTDIIGCIMANIFEQIDNKMMGKKLEKAMEMFKTQSPDELKAHLENVDKNELIKKLGELDKEKVKSMNIDTEKIKNSLNNADMEKIKAVAGKDADKVMAKLKELLGG